MNTGANAAAAMLLSGLVHATALAGEADVIGVEAWRAADGEYRVAVTMRHADSGWEHYADRWEVLTADGELLATRVLAHPHETEQPFTRSLSGVRIPASVTEVRIRARDSLHGFGGAELRLPLTGAEHARVPAD